MKDILVINTVEQLLELNPVSADEDSYDIVMCNGKLQYLSKKAYVESIMKLCYVCRSVLFLEVLSTSSWEWEFAREDEISIPSEAWVTKQINHAAFSVIGRNSIGKMKERRELYVAEKMLKIEWQKKKFHLYDYPDNTVIEVPLSHSGFDWYWDYLENRDKEREIRREEEDKFINDFKIWYYTPIVYCKACKSLHDGKHRLMIAKQIGRKTVDLRISDTPKRFDGRCAKEKAWARRKIWNE